MSVVSGAESFKGPTAWSPAPHPFTVAYPDLFAQEPIPILLPRPPNQEKK